MYITCKQCDTIFRLDESLVKPTGSKARCCQCRNVFVIYPPEPEKTESYVAAMQAVPSEVPQAVSVAALDQELEGIDLAELDSILEQDKGLDEEMPVSAVAEQDTVIDDAVAELDESDLDLDFTIEPEGEKQQPEKAQEAVADMDIDDLDLDMDFELDDGLDDVGIATVDESKIEATATKAPVADVPPTGEELELELDQLDLSLDEDEPAIEAPPAEEEAVSDELDLLGADFVLEEDTHETAAPEAVDQELELSLEDDQPALELAPEEPVAAEAGPEEAIDDLDLSDLDAVLGLDEESEQAALDLPESTGEEDLELSLADDTAVDELPDFEIEEEPELKLDEEPALELDEEPALELDEEPVLELDEEFDSGAEQELELEMASDDLVAEVPADEGDDLDLSDLDAMLSGAPEDSEAALETDEALDLELELDDDDAALAGTTGDELEDLSFELDSEFEDEPVLEEPKEEAVAAEDDEEIDLSDIEQMLEGDDTAATLGLTVEPVEAADGEMDLGDADEFDLTDIEAAIDAADKEAGGEISLEEELSLDDVAAKPTPELESEPESEMEIELEDLALELESDASTVEVEPITAADDSDELDLSDLGELVEEQDDSTTTETIDTGDIELEFEVSDEPLEEAAAISQTAGVETADLETTFPIEETFPEQVGMGEIEEEIAPVKKKKRSGKGLLFLLILVLLGGAGYLFYAVSYMGIEIPYLSDYLNPKPKDPAGVLNLATLDINSKFIENEKSGRLFVVTGKLRNGKDTARRLIRLQGKLFTTGKVLAKTEFTYGGVSLKDQEISQQAIADIKKQINSPSGPAAAVKVLPGQTVPFMIVFSDLPEGLDEFAIEVISSMQAQ